MKFIFSPEFKKGYKKLPGNIKKKTDKQLRLLEKDFRYSSLRAKKMQGFENVWEARVTLNYRMCFSPTKETIFVLSVGPHDRGLGKK